MNSALEFVELLKTACSEVREMWAIPSVPRVAAVDLTPEAFVTRFVAPSRPVIITGAIEEWRARRLWDAAYLEARYGRVEATVNLTPDGWGDFVTRVADPSRGVPFEAFVKPLERRMTISELLARIRSGYGPPGATPKRSPYIYAFEDGSDSVARGGAEDIDDVADGVPYLSYQNDNLRDPSQLASLRGDIPARPFASFCPTSWGAAGAGGAGSVDALNIWIGDYRSVTSCHKDHYENLYAVIRGAKTFILLPPADILWLYEKRYQPTRFVRRRTSGIATASASSWSWRVDYDNTEGCEGEGGVPWVPVDPAAPDLRRWPLFANASPVSVTVAAGEVLYLPALWYHRVASEPAPLGNDHTTIAVNAWFDMDYESQAWAYYNMCHSLARVVVSGSNDDS